MLNGNTILDYPAHNLNISYFNNRDINAKLTTRTRSRAPRATRRTGISTSRS